MNLDAVGVTFGGKQNAFYNNKTVPAKLTTINLLLISDSDKGSLNSEWYVGFWANNRLLAKLVTNFYSVNIQLITKFRSCPTVKKQMTVLGLREVWLCLVLNSLVLENKCNKIT